MLGLTTALVSYDFVDIHESRSECKLNAIRLLASIFATAVCVLSLLLLVMSALSANDMGAGRSRCDEHLQAAPLFVCDPEAKG